MKRRDLLKGLLLTPAALIFPEVKPPVAIDETHLLNDAPEVDDLGGFLVPAEYHEKLLAAVRDMRTSSHLAWVYSESDHCDHCERLKAVNEKR